MQISAELKSSPALYQEPTEEIYDDPAKTLAKRLEALKKGYRKDANGPYPI